MRIPGKGRHHFYQSPLHMKRAKAAPLEDGQERASLQKTPRPTSQKGTSASTRRHITTTGKQKYVWVSLLETLPMSIRSIHSARLSCVWAHKHARTYHAAIQRDRSSSMPDWDRARRRWKPTLCVSSADRLPEALAVIWILTYTEHVVVITFERMVRLGWRNYVKSVTNRTRDNHLTIDQLARRALFSSGQTAYPDGPP